MDFELLNLDEIAKVPWRNGAGLMREIAAEPPGVGLASMDWKFSLAETTETSQFSAFPGIDRSIVLLRGAGLRLHFIDDALVVSFDDPTRPVNFQGESKVLAELIDGPSENLSILLRRDRYWTAVTWVDKGHDIPASDALLVLCLSGAVQLSGVDGNPVLLQAQQAGLWRKGSAGVRVQVVQPTGRALAVRLNRRPDTE